MNEKKWVDFTIPLAKDSFAVMRLMVPMTAKEWDQLLRVLSAMSPGLVE